MRPKTEIFVPAAALFWATTSVAAQSRDSEPEAGVIVEEIEAYGDLEPERVPDWAQFEFAVTAHLSTGIANEGESNTLVSIENLKSSDFDDSLTSDAGNHLRSRLFMARPSCNGQASWSSTPQVFQIWNGASHEPLQR